MPSPVLGTTTPLINLIYKMIQGSRFVIDGKIKAWRTGFTCVTFHSKELEASVVKPTVWILIYLSFPI
jgi:hypothetical protein